MVAIDVEGMESLLDDSDASRVPSNSVRRQCGHLSQFPVYAEGDETSTTLSGRKVNRRKSLAAQLEESSRMPLRNVNGKQIARRAIAVTKALPVMPDADRGCIPCWTCWPEPKSIK